ncbi:MAG: LD-carboxypeptidase [Rubrivivax sp.]|jgi:muramoyltetrapeptide carboxypeptidase|nr:LD-carboxypeptidase [Rubrivivax sp.]
MSADAVSTLRLFSASGVVAEKPRLRQAARHLSALGYQVQQDDTAAARHQRFAGTDEQRLQALHRTAAARPAVAMATRGGYGLTRLLDGIDWPALARSVDNGTRWVGHSDMTALQLGLLAHTGASSWAGPMAQDDFGVDTPDDVTSACFAEAMTGELEAVGFRTDAGLDGLDVKGTLWGGNLTVLCSLLGTPHMPKVRGGILFVEDVNEHPYRVERQLLQLAQAGVLARQKALVLGAFTAWKPSPLDRGYTLKTAVEAVRSRVDLPVLTGLPFGHVATKVTLPVGRRVALVVQGRDALIGW